MTDTNTLLSTDVSTILSNFKSSQAQQLDPEHLQENLEVHYKTSTQDDTRAALATCSEGSLSLFNNPSALLQQIGVSGKFVRRDGFLNIVQVFSSLEKKVRSGYTIPDLASEDVQEQSKAQEMLSAYPSNTLIVIKSQEMQQSDLEIIKAAAIEITDLAQAEVDLAHELLVEDEMLEFIELETVRINKHNSNVILALRKENITAAIKAHKQ